MGTVRASGSHGVPVQVQQPNDNDPQPAYQPAPAQNPQPAYQPAPAPEHHNENAPPPHILLAPQVYNRCHRLKMVRL